MSIIIRQILAPPVFENDEDRTRIAKNLHIFLLWVCLGIVVASVWMVLPSSNQPLAVLVMGGLLVCLMGALAFLRAGRVQLATWSVSLFFWGLVTFTVVLSGGPSSPENLGYIVVVMVAALLSSARTTVLFAILSGMSVLGIGLASQFKWMPQPLLPIQPTGWIAVTLANIALVTGIVWLSIRGLDDALHAARVNGQKLRESNTALQNARALLESQVDEHTRKAEAARLEAEAARQALEAQVWLARGQAQLSDRLRGEQDIPTLAANIIQQVCQYLNAQFGALFVVDQGVLKMVGSYAYTYRKSLSNQFRLGEGLVGQAALEKTPIVITDLPQDYVTISSGLIQAPPRNLLVSPFMHGDQVVGVIELGVLADFTAEQIDFLHAASESIAVAFRTAYARSQIDELLSQTRQQAAELQKREERLQSVNEELQAQTNNLRASQEKLRMQQTELQSANAELEERAWAMQEQQTILDNQNRQLKAAQQELEKRAQDLAQANKYKSEFLANVSHELRTPLNSLLILARVLASNEEGNLTPDQVESAGIIYNSGNDLLSLINEILDLSKVEAGRMQFYPEPMLLRDLADSMRSQFTHMADEKGLVFEVAIAEDAPPTIVTDQQRVEQIVKNLVSNALKFTDKGGVRLSIHRPAADVDLSRSDLQLASAVAISVTDTGIGITPDQQKIVFEAFQQADGSTSRKYGGTGLGLAISRELATRLGGQIDLHSVVGQGSTFTLYLPIGETPAGPPALAAPERIFSDDRNALSAGDRRLLVIEDDPGYAQVVYNHAHKNGFKCLLAGNGEIGIELAQAHQPDAIILDLKLPDQSGWDVLEALKQNAQTRHIPVQILSALDETADAFKMGAIGFLTKPATAAGLDSVFQRIERFISIDIRSLLVVEDDTVLRKSIGQLLAGIDIQITEVSRGGEALDLMRSRHFDCMILDLGLPDMTGFELLNRVNSDPTISRCPIIVYTGRSLTEQENAELIKYADSVILKGAHSPERLLDETALLLHRVVAEMPKNGHALVPRPRDGQAVLAGKHILVVDDDMRNAYALSKLLGEKEIEVTIARSGLKALEILDSVPDIHLVLMDIMMPEMDGYEAIERIRAQARFHALPILAITAKAMKGDQDKCLSAGANDYLSKPVDPERLFSLLRVWLC